MEFIFEKKEIEMLFFTEKLLERKRKIIDNLDPDTNLLYIYPKLIYRDRDNSDYIEKYIIYILSILHYIHYIFPSYKMYILVNHFNPNDMLQYEHNKMKEAFITNIYSSSRKRQYWIIYEYFKRDIHIITNIDIIPKDEPSIVIRDPFLTITRFRDEIYNIIDNHQRIMVIDIFLDTSYREFIQDDNISIICSKNSEYIGSSIFDGELMSGFEIESQQMEGNIYFPNNNKYSILFDVDKYLNFLNRIKNPDFILFLIQHIDDISSVININIYDFFTILYTEFFGLKYYDYLMGKINQLNLQTNWCADFIKETYSNTIQLKDGKKLLL